MSPCWTVLSSQGPYIWTCLRLQGLALNDFFVAASPLPRQSCECLRFFDFQALALNSFFPRHCCAYLMFVFQVFFLKNGFQENFVHGLCFFRSQDFVSKTENVFVLLFFFFANMCFPRASKKCVLKAAPEKNNMSVSGADLKKHVSFRRRLKKTFF